MGKGGRKLENGDSKVIPWSEIETHNNRNDSWVVILGRVYNDVWTGMHNDKDFVGKFMKPLYIGDAEQRDTIELENDFRELRKHVEDSDLLRVNPMFYILHLVSILAFEVAGYLILSRLGISWFPYITAATCFLISQGASSHWWNFRHFLHHAKPNIIKIDPDVKTANLFLLGEVMPKLFGTKKRGMMPYQYQHVYFFLLSPLLLPTYFVFENLFFVVKRRDYVDLFFTASFFFKLFSLLGPILGGWGTFWFFMFVRFFESYWFVWCTQMSHIPNEVDFDHAKDWFRLQLDSTCNVNPSWFNDWFSGHLNYQIEHHLFPTMPRHNFGKIAPLVISLAKKHGVKYSCKSLPTAFADILRSLEHSGEIWYNAYYEGLDS
ncbi:FADS2-like protein [Mya arenaria]|uniref:FADS2-like protein n=1 Tax=Mya arenaria TaxID=6604 RepID=A0ABY7EJA5_MYAAR|nr:FADS2-like protein [Mya arenaria]